MFYKVCFSVGLFFFLSGCSVLELEGELFYKSVRDNSFGPHGFAISLTEGDACQRTDFSSDYYNREGRKRKTRLISKKQCAPFLLARKIRKEFGDCKPVSKVLKSVRPRSFGRITHYLKIDESCLCYYYVTDYDHYYSRRNPSIYRAFATAQACRAYFGEEEIKRIIQLGKEVDRELGVSSGS